MRTTLLHRSRGFSLVELLVVIGIISLLSGMLMPALMRARRASQTTVCLANMRQLGVFYYLYADANKDRIPLGTSATKPDMTDYYTAWNQYIWREGAPSSAGGPFVLSGLIKPAAAKIFYCPLEAQDQFAWENFEHAFESALNGEHVTILSSYAVRPTRNVWITDPESHTVEYPLMPKLVKLHNLALMSEHPQAGPFNHGTVGNYYVHALYADGSVRPVPFKAFFDAYFKYLLIAPPAGFTAPSNAMAFDENNSTANAIWQNIDRY
jgi:prepilin-type N-terminal cleavage/methylation domain-containing protein